MDGRYDLHMVLMLSRRVLSDYDGRRLGESARFGVWGARNGEWLSAQSRSCHGIFLAHFLNGSDIDF